MTTEENYLYCDDCDFLSITEKEQDTYKHYKPKHKCILYGGFLNHYGKHPHIPRPENCLRLGKPEPWDEDEEG